MCKCQFHWCVHARINLHSLNELVTCPKTVAPCLFGKFISNYYLKPNVDIKKFAVQECGHTGTAGLHKGKGELSFYL
jgi:hypothetical protein